MQKFAIKISGSGTAEEISDALLRVLGTFDNATEDELSNATWEDETLITEIAYEIE